MLAWDFHRSIKIQIQFSPWTHQNSRKNYRFIELELLPERKRKPRFDGLRNDIWVKQNSN